MAEPVYLLKTAKGADKSVKERLHLKAVPSYVRLATVAPLSNYGFPPGAEGALLRFDSEGAVIGVADGEGPRLFVPMQNIAYLADAAGLAGEK